MSEIAPAGVPSCARPAPIFLVAAALVAVGFPIGSAAAQGGAPAASDRAIERRLREIYDEVDGLRDVRVEARGTTCTVWRRSDLPDGEASLRSVTSARTARPKADEEALDLTRRSDCR